GKKSDHTPREGLQEENEESTKEMPPEGRMVEKPERRISAEVPSKEGVSKKRIK
ncbi:hypothetical protein HIR70_08905, partial [Pasteurella multocida]|nr:hypothetical protein [Pasteurella multocida]NMR62868.1 hypothetical protein [Pasteurella multocida]